MARKGHSLLSIVRPCGTVGFITVGLQRILCPQTNEGTVAQFISVGTTPGFVAVGTSCSIRPSLATPPSKHCLPNFLGRMSPINFNDPPASTRCVQATPSMQCPTTPANPQRIVSLVLSTPRLSPLLVCETLPSEPAMIGIWSQIFPITSYSIEP